MSREIKRVALDFKWELHKQWIGYVNPYYTECHLCGGECDVPAADGKCGRQHGVYDDESCTWQEPYFVEAYQNWQPIEPPVGAGWQMWETVSDGSPVSPVFSTRAALVEWMKENHYSAWAIQDVENGQTWLPSALGWTNVGLVGVQE